MTEVQPGVALPYEANFGVPALDFVAMTVLDESGPTPVVVQGPAAMLNVIGGMYRGKFTATAGKVYSIFKTVYTDGTYTVRDDDYPESSETIHARVDAAPVVSLVDLSGVLDDNDDLNGTIEDADALTATLEDDDVLT